MAMRFCLLLFSSSALLAQSAAEVFAKAPPEVDAALRERITLFYKLHGEGKFRQAEEMVAEDTKDYFYNSNKPKFLDCEIRKIEYSADFTRAKALIAASQRVAFPGFGTDPIKIPHNSRWKLENGQWYWWMDPEELKMTPFGKMGSADPNAPKGPAPTLAGKPDVSTVLAMVVADKTSVALQSAKGAADSVRVSNRMPGRAELALSGPAPEGLEVSIDSPTLQANAIATVTIRVTDPAKAPKRAMLNLVVQPLGMLIPLAVSVGSSN